MVIQLMTTFCKMIDTTKIGNELEIVPKLKKNLFNINTS